MSKYIRFAFNINFIDEEKKDQCRDLMKNIKARGKKKFNDEIIFDALTMYLEYLKNN